MNEEELKKIWQADKTEPTINFGNLQKSLNDWQTKLRRKARFEIWIQNLTVFLNFIPVIFYPKWIFFALSVAILGIWYIPELRKIYKLESTESGDVRKLLTQKILTMKRYFRRTRIALYVFSPPLVPIAFYGFGYFEHHSISLQIWMLWMLLMIVISETAIIIFNEIYFAIAYKPAFNELKKMLSELEVDDNHE